jgi:hypothetical protein
VLPKPLANAIVILVTVVWAANFILQFIVPTYKTDPLIHTAFMAIVGAAFAFSRKDKDTDKKDKPDTEKKDDTKAGGE